jgi:hypothetical protein
LALSEGKGTILTVTTMQKEKRPDKIKLKRATASYCEAVRRCMSCRFASRRSQRRQSLAPFLFLGRTLEPSCCETPMVMLLKKRQERDYELGTSRPRHLWIL